MCVIIVVPNNAKRPDDDVFYMAEKANDDGGGIAWIEKHRGSNMVFWRKGLSAKEMLKIAPAEGPFVAHFRISTRGAAIPELCHPFPISPGVPLHLSGKANKVLFHNGTWMDYQKYVMSHAEKPFPKGPWSDSRGMAYLAHKFGVDFLDLVDQKICMLDADENNFFIWNPSAWSKEGDIYYSNTNFRHSKKAGTYYGPYYSSEYKKEDTNPTQQKLLDSSKESNKTNKKSHAENDTISIDEVIQEAISDIKEIITGFDSLPDAQKAQMLEDYSGIILDPDDIKTFFPAASKEKNDLMVVNG